MHDAGRGRQHGARPLERSLTRFEIKGCSSVSDLPASVLIFVNKAMYQRPTSAVVCVASCSLLKMGQEHHQRLLSNPVYLGKQVWDRRDNATRREHGGSAPWRAEDEWTVCEDTHEAIVSGESFDATQERLRGKSRCLSSGHSRGRRREHLSAPRPVGPPRPGQPDGGAAGRSGPRRR